MNKIKTIKEFRSKFPKVYSVLSYQRNHKLLCKILNIKTHIILTEEMIMKSAKKHDTKIAWIKADSAAYRRAKKLGIFEKATSHMQKLKVKPTKIECILMAKKCKTRNEFQQKFKRYYANALKYNCLNECYAHMKPAKTNPKSVINLNTNQIYSSIFSTGICTGNIHRAIKNNLTAGGFRWAYCDKNGKIIK